MRQAVRAAASRGQLPGQRPAAARTGRARPGLRPAAARDKRSPGRPPGCLPPATCVAEPAARRACPQRPLAWLATRMSAPGHRMAAHTPHSSLSAPPSEKPEQATRRGGVLLKSRVEARSRSASWLRGEMARLSNWSRKPASEWMPLDE